MKKILITLTALLVFSAASGRDDDRHRVIVSEPSIEKSGDEVTVSFRAEVGRRVAGRNYSLVFAPVLTDNMYVWALPAIVVEGRGANISRDRGQLGGFRNEIFDGAVITRNGRTVEYRATVPYQLWMEGGRLVMESLSIGCCSSSVLVTETMADDLILQPRKYTEPVVIAEKPAEEAPAPVLPPTTAEKLAENYPFILPYSQFESVDPGHLYDDDRENSITVYYAQGSTRLQPSYGDNSRALIDLMTTIRAIEQSRDSKVSAILIAGFASPEGSFDVNDRLAWNRAVALKKYIIEHSTMGDSEIHIYNGSEDWRGLRMLVESSDMPYKGQVLDIIDNVPVWDSARGVGRLGELMRLAEGMPYRYMLRYFFPQLRNAAYVKVYYENK